MSGADPDLIAGRRFHDAGRWDLAERHLRAGLARQPLSAEDHAYLARALINLGRRWEARVESDESVRLAPRSPEVLAARIDVLDGVGDRGGAVDVGRDLVTLLPASASARAALAFALYRRGRPRAALEAADQALAIDPNDLGALNARAVALGALLRPDEAEVALREALRRSPESPGLHNNIGLMLLQQGQVSTARGAIQESLRLDPMSERAATNLRRSRNPFIRALAILLGGFVRGLRRWSRWPVGVQVGLIVGLLFGGLAWSGAPAAGFLVLVWSADGWLRRIAPDATARLARALEKVPLAMVSLPALGLYYVFQLVRIGGPITGIGALLGFLLPFVLGLPARTGQDEATPGRGFVPSAGDPGRRFGRTANLVGGGLALAGGGLALLGVALPWVRIDAPDLPAYVVHGFDGSRGTVIAVLGVVAIAGGLARLPSAGPAGWRRGAAIAGALGMIAAAVPGLSLLLEGIARVTGPATAALGPGLPLIVGAGAIALVGGLLGGAGPAADEPA